MVMSILSNLISAISIYALYLNDYTQIAVKFRKEKLVTSELQLQTKLHHFLLPNQSGIFSSVMSCIKSWRYKIKI